MVSTSDVIIKNSSQVIVNATETAVSSSNSIDWFNILYSFMPIIFCIILVVLVENNVCFNLWCKKRFAVILSAKGEIIKTQRIYMQDKTFKYEKGQYIINPLAFSFEVKTLFRKKEFFFYVFDNPTPLEFGNKEENKVNAEIMNNLLETKVIKDLNDLSNEGFSKYLTMKNVIIALIVIGVIWYLASGGEIIK
jgi:hypothetical protein